jgi:hypothetical protein
VVADGPGFPRQALRLGALGHRPLVACTVDGDGVRREAIEVRESPGVGVRLRIEVANSGDDRRPRALLLSNGNARGEEFSVGIHCNEIAKMKR